MENTIYYTSFDSRLGWVLLAAGDRGVCMLHFCGPDAPSNGDAEELIRSLDRGLHPRPGEHVASLAQAAQAVRVYLEEAKPLPSSIPLDLRGGTPFQHDVWTALGRIPFGETRSYQEIAEAVGRPAAARAVGQACGRNPVALFVPCHRVVGSKGKLTGFGGGLHVKEALLELEARKVVRGEQ